MKNGLLVTLLITAIVLVACGGPSKPKYMTQSTYDNGCHALELMDKYNDAEISKEDAKDRLRGLYESLHSEYETLTGSMESTNNTLISGYIIVFIAAIDGSSTSTTYEQADKLRELLEK